VIYLLDSNIFLRFLVKEDEESHQKCAELLGLVKSNKIKAVVPGIVVTEIGWVLKSNYNTPKNDIANKLEGIIKLKNLKVTNQYDWPKSIDIYRKHNIKLIDAVLATIPMVASLQWTIVSFDEDFKKLPILWKKPSELI